MLSSTGRATLRAVFVLFVEPVHYKVEQPPVVMYVVLVMTRPGSSNVLGEGNNGTGVYRAIVVFSASR